MPEPSRWSSRKFIAAMAWQGVFTWLLWASKIDQEAYQWLSLITIGGYFGANVLSYLWTPKQ